MLRREESPWQRRIESSSLNRPHPTAFTTVTVRALSSHLAMFFRRVPFQRWPVWRHATLAGLLLGAAVIGGWGILQNALVDSALIVRQTVDLQAKLASLPGPAAPSPTLLDSLPSPLKSEDVGRDIARFAQAADVQLVSLAIEARPSTANELGRILFNVAAQAEYKNAKTWLAQLQGRYSALGVQSLSIRAHPTDAARQEVRLALVLYVKD